MRARTPGQTKRKQRGARAWGGGRAQDFYVEAVAGDNHVLELVAQIGLLIGPACGEMQLDILEVPPVGTGLQEQGRGLVDPLRQAHVPVPDVAAGGGLHR